MNNRSANPVAIFGGTFDPPHLGHEKAILEIIEQFKLRRLWIIPSNQPPLKTTQTDFNARFEMTQILVKRIIHQRSQQEACFPCEIEVKSIEKDLSIHYTYDLLSHLKAQSMEVTFIMGSDQFLQWPKWNRFPEVVGLADWIIWKRAGTDDDQLHQNIRLAIQQGWLNPDWTTQGKAALSGSKKIQFVPIDAPQISSTEVRHSFARNGIALKNFISPDTLNYIERNGLYGNPRNHRD